MDGVKGLFSNAILDEFSSHSSRMRSAARSRREAVQLRAVVDDHADAVAVDIKDTLGVRQENDKYAGCVNLRTLRTLLSMVDDRGFERSPHQVRATVSHCLLLAAHATCLDPQMKFHSSFERCVSRVIYKQARAYSNHPLMRGG